MELKLNKLSDAQVVDEIARGTRMIEKVLASKPATDAGPERFERYYNSLGGYSFDIGACLYQQQSDLAEIQQQLQRAGGSLMNMHALRGEPKPNTSRNPWTYKKALNLVACFGTLEEQKLAGTISESAYRNPPRQDNETIATYVGVLGRFIATKDLETVLLEDLVENSSADNASKDIVTWVLPAVKGLQALILADEVALNAAIENLIKTHSHAAQKDDFYSKAPNGFLCMPGLMLAKLGNEKNLACTVKSDYLPLQLLEPFK